MKIIEQYGQILDRRELSNAEKIEQAGRLAYKSEDKIEEGSARGFVNRLYKKGHYPVFEFAVLHIVVHTTHMEVSSFLNSRVNLLKYIAIDTFKVIGTTEDTVTMLMTGSVRAFQELIDRQPRNCALGDTLGWFLENELAEDFYSDDYPKQVSEGATVIVQQVDVDYLKQLPYDMRMKHYHVAVKFVTNRAVTHEMVRHRPCAFIQESQRYCRYNLKRFEREVTFIAPTAFFGRDTAEWNVWREAMQISEHTYMSLLDKGLTAQAARTVLPNSCKTEIIVFASLTQWGHIFELRVSPEAEPSMQQVMRPVKKQMIEADAFFE